jgi:TRAP-type C4-dicarboxylate transport system substrate-binding protein
MNLKKWNQLPEDIQATITDLDNEFRPMIAKAYDDNDKDAIKKAQKAGVEIYALSSQNKNEIAEKVIPVWQDWINDNEKKGYPAKKVYQAYVRIMKDLKQEVLVKVPGLYQE